MIWVDFLILGIIVISALISLVRGFVREAISLLGWVLAIWLAVAFAAPFSNILSSFIDTPRIRDALAFMLLVVGVILLSAMLNLAAGRFVKKTGLGGTDRMIGVLFGLGRGTIIVAALVLLGALLNFTTASWWQDSLLLAYFQQVALWLREFLPPNIASAIQLP